MMRLTKLDGPGLDSLSGLDPDLGGPFRGGPVSGAVAIRQRPAGIVEVFDVDIGGPRIVVGVAPTQVPVMAGAYVRGAQNSESGDVETLIAVQMRFVTLATAEEGDVRIDQQHRMPGGGAVRRDGPHVRAFVSLLRRARHCKAR